MSNSVRICLPDVTYHCYSRCIEERNMLSPYNVKELAADAINMALEKYDFQLIHMEFVENHFHMLIKTVENGQTISQIMQYIKARITEKYNRVHDRTGTFWNERFRCTIVDHQDNPEKYLLRLLWYIAYNPVRKNVIKDPRESEFGTIRVYLEKEFKPRVHVTIHEYFFTLSKTFEESAKYLLEYEYSYKDRYT
jgi:putative transposase